jgi:hypothetical protein
MRSCDQCGSRDRVRDVEVELVHKPGQRSTVAWCWRCESASSRWNRYRPLTQGGTRRSRSGVCQQPLERLPLRRSGRKCPHIAARGARHHLLQGRERRFRRSNCLLPKGHRPEVLQDVEGPTPGGRIAGRTAVVRQPRVEELRRRLLQPVRPSTVLAWGVDDGRRRHLHPFVAVDREGGRRWRFHREALRPPP